MNEIYIALLLPLAGTVLGAAGVFLLKDRLPALLQKVLLGFASGVMVAASVWSLLIPCMEISAVAGQQTALPAATGFLCGMGFLLLMDKITPHLHLDCTSPEGPHTRLSRTQMLTLAVTLHNLPEGMAIGVVLAGALEAGSTLSTAAVLTLALGIAIQNIPEGAIISMPMRTEGHGKWQSFAIGALSGVVEPVGALLTLLLASAIAPVLPYLLAFAAGAMMYVVIEELIPEASAGKHSDFGTLGFAAGFVIMMVLDVVLG